MKGMQLQQSSRLREQQRVTKNVADSEERENEKRANGRDDNDFIESRKDNERNFASWERSKAVDWEEALDSSTGGGSDRLSIIQTNYESLSCRWLDQSREAAN